MKYYAFYVGEETGGLYCSNGVYFPSGYTEVDQETFEKLGGIVPSKSSIELEQEQLKQKNDDLNSKIQSIQQSSYLFQQSMLAYVEGLS